MTQPSETLAIIPARGGSKGIPRKNVLPLAGKPLIAHTIEQARCAHHVDRVVVSTDDQEIATVSQQYRAEVVWRTAALSGDTASSESALLHALEYLEQHEGYHPDVTVFLQCTSPLTMAEDIDGTIATLVENNAASALSVTPFHYFLWQADEQGNAVGINHNKQERLLRQQRPVQFLETGAIYVMQTEEFRRTKHRFFGKTALYIMPQERCLEIDEPSDFTVAEVLLRERISQQQADVLAPVELLILDFDGVMTDNRVLVDQDGREAVWCHRGDGWGIACLKEAEVKVMVLSTESNPVVAARCQKLAIPYIQACKDKASALTEIMQEHALQAHQVAYVGNDVNDLDCMQRVGVPIAVADAIPDIRAIARFVTTASGGWGAVREVAEWFLKVKQ